MGFKLLIYTPKAYDNLLLVRRIGDLVSHNREVTSLLNSFADVSNDSRSHNHENLVLNLFTTLIILIPCQEKYVSNVSVFRRFYILLKPWNDAYGAPYKDTYRSWTGILLLIRCILGLVVHGLDK